MTRLGLHLHLYYPDIALELIGRVAALGEVAVIATHVGRLDPAVAAALDRLEGPVERVEVANRGWDIGPLLHILPRVRALGWDAIAHLHTKKGDSGYASEWRAIGYDGLIADAELVARIGTAFDDPALQLVGPAAVYKSAASHQFANAELLSELAPKLLAPLYPPADWGFFAGSLFWARIALLERLAPFADFGEGDERDGTLAHALERLIGLTPIATGGSIGLVGEDGAIETIRAPGVPSHEPIIRTLVDRAERFVAPLNEELAALIVARNPLADYIRHGRDEAALDPNPYFSSQWYNRIHADVFASGAHPFHHYLHHGAAEGRSTGPLFDGLYYRTAYPDVTGDPLRHFLEEGARAGRVAIPISRPEHDGAGDGPTRFYRHFDIAGEEAFLREMAGLPAKISGAVDETLVSVIMPAWNREGTIGAAIRSVLAQTHARLELIVVDDGSSDGTRGEVARFMGDPRVRLIEGAHVGVSAARNLGLESATGEFVAYLDSDNRWTGWFLDVMLRFLTARGLEAGYSAIASRDDLGQLTGYRGAEFDWEACFTQNYVDLNAFVHRRALIGEVGGFDPHLKRMVDWDLILRLGKGRPIGYAPFVGCDYFDGKADKARVTVGEPAAFQRLVWTKHGLGIPTGSPQFAAAVKLTFAIKIAAPEAEQAAWGDYHFADALAAEIERLGHIAHVDFREGWTGRSIADEDVVIVLRGLLPYPPRTGQMSFLWNISHPDQVPFEEYDRFTRVYVASESHAALLRHIIRPPVTALLQATDPERFHPIDAPGDGPDVLFVGNSRGVERDIVRWAIAAGHPPEIHGDGWDGLVPPELVASDNIDNRALGPLYAAARAVLNDHWPSMQAHGYLSNRLFDVVAAGGRAVSDAVPSIAAVFGDAVAEVDGPAALKRALTRPVRLNPARAADIAERHSFDQRARVLVRDAFALLGLDAPTDPLPAKPRALLRVHVLAPHGPYGPQSSAMIRLIAPLTDESVAGRVAVTLGKAEEPLPPCDICIVQRTAMPSEAAVDALVARLASMGAVLVTDVDDAFAALDNHPEAAIYAPRAAALERAIAASAETWFSSEPLAELYGRIAGRRRIARNAIDPRLWRDWRHPRPAPFQGDRVRMLYMGTHTHAADWALIRPALDRLWETHEGRFDVTLIGVATEVAPAPWLQRLSPPPEAIPYPRFVRWLRGQGPFDIGLAPLAETRFNRAKSDIKLLDYAALGLLPVVSRGPAYEADAGMADLAIVTDDWHTELAGVIDDRDPARDRAVALHARLWATRTVSRIAPGLVDRLEMLVA